MKIFTATAQTQGTRSDDFFFCQEGEIVHFGVFRCSTEKLQRRCGCYRSMVGLVTSKATTTFKVEDMNLRIDDLAKMVYSHWERGGWITAHKPIADELGPFTMAHAKRIAEELEIAALPFDVGSICECAGLQINRRTTA